MIQWVYLWFSRSSISIFQLRNQAQEVCRKCEEHYTQSVVNKGISSKWSQQPRCTDEDRWFVERNFFGEKILKEIIK